MSGYANQTVVKSLRVNTTVADNTDIDAIIVPAGKEITIKNMYCYPINDSDTASAKIELVNAANAILLSVAIDGTDATIAEATQTRPLKFTAGTSDTALKVRTDQSTGTCDVIIEIHYEYPGSF